MEAMALRAACHPERLQIPGRNHVLGAVPGLEVIDDLQRRRIDHRDLAGNDLGNIDPRQCLRDRRAEPARCGFAVEIGRDRRPAAFPPGQVAAPERVAYPPRSQCQPGRLREPTARSVPTRPGRATPGEPAADQNPNELIIPHARLRSGRLSTAQFLPDRGDRLAHDSVHAKLAEIRARPPRVAVNSVGGDETLVRSQAIRPDQARIGGEHERGIGEAGMGADFGRAEAVALQGPDVGRFAGAVVFQDRMTRTDAVADHSRFSRSATAFICD